MWSYRPSNGARIDKKEYASPLPSSGGLQ